LARGKKERDKKRKLYVLVSALFAILMLVPAWLGRGGGGVAISKSDLEKYLFTPESDKYTIMLFLASPKECPVCPEVANNVTQAVELLKQSIVENKLNITVEFKVFTCEGFPQCKDKEALVNFQVYRVSQVPLLLLSYRGLLVPFDPTGLGPRALASLLAQWYQVMSHAWRPPKEGKYLLYLYDKSHQSPYLDSLLKHAEANNVTVVELGCEAYPNNCTDVRSLSTMLVLGVTPNDLPLAIVYEDGRAVAAAKVDRLEGVDRILQALRN